MTISPLGTSYLDPKEIQSILDQPKSEKIRQSFQEAVENNRIQAIDILINSNHLHMIGAKLFSEGLNLLLEKESTEVENIIVNFADKEPHHTFKYYFLCDAFRNALQYQYTKFIEASIRFIHPEELIDCLEKENFIGIEESRVNKNFLSIIKIFLDRTSLTSLCKLLYILSDKNYMKQTETVISSPDILNSTNYGKAFVQAVQDLQLDTIQLFIKSARFDTIGSEDLDKALQSPYRPIREMIIKTNRIKKLNIMDLSNRYIKLCRS